MANRIDSALQDMEVAMPDDQARESPETKACQV
jgi:hypothetical protein